MPVFVDDLARRRAAPLGTRPLQPYNTVCDYKYYIMMMMMCSFVGRSTVFKPDCMYKYI